MPPSVTGHHRGGQGIRLRRCLSLVAAITQRPRPERSQGESHRRACAVRRRLKPVHLGRANRSAEHRSAVVAPFTSEPGDARRSRKSPAEATLGAALANPEGIASSSPRLRVPRRSAAKAGGTSYLGSRFANENQPQRGCDQNRSLGVSANLPQPRWGYSRFATLIQGRRGHANLRFGPKPRWGWREMDAVVKERMARLFGNG